jgi:hypothetical protein
MIINGDLGRMTPTFIMVYAQLSMTTRGWSLGVTKEGEGIIEIGER